MNASTVVAFVGSVREPHRMIEAIDELRFQSNAPDRVLLSTWIGEIDRFAGLRDALDLRGVETIEAAEPIAFRAQPSVFIHRGHVFHQKLALSNALERVAPNDWVVKSRPDLKLHGGSDLQRMLVGSARPIPDGLARIVGYTERIRSRQMSLSSPFWLDDTHFAGTASTLSLMTSFDASYDIKCHSHIAIPEVRFFHALVAGRFPICDLVLRVPFNFGMFYAHGERDAFLTIALEDPFFSKALFAYFSIVAALVDFGGAYGAPDDQRMRMVEMCNNDHAHLTDGSALRREATHWQERTETDLFETLSGPRYFAPGEWEAFVRKLRAIGAVELPRTRVNRGKGPFPRLRPEEVPPFQDRLEQLRQSPFEAAGLEAYLRPLLETSSLNAYVPPELLCNETYRITGTLILKDGDVLWNEALGGNSIVLTYFWRRSDLSEIEGDPVGLPHSILSDWVFFLSITAPPISGPWLLVLRLRSPSLHLDWKDAAYEVNILSEASPQVESASSVSIPTWSGHK